MREFGRILSTISGFVIMASPLASAVAAPPGHGEVRIQRDDYGVPHVFASTTYGLFYGFGAALAEDQLYQIEILKRTAEGKVAEVLGRDYLATDQATRQKIDMASLQRQFSQLAPADQDIFRGMAAGISARIRASLGDRRLLPKGFIDNDFLPESWTPVDVIAIYQHSMALRFSDLNSELDNLALLTRLRRSRSPDQAWHLFEQLRWVSDDNSPTTIAAGDQRKGSVPTFGAVSNGQGLPNRLTELPDAVLYGTPVAALATTQPHQVLHASNAWLASSPKANPGIAILVNGPQMGDYASAYIWAVGLHGAGFDVVGSGPVGSPWLIFGSNGEIGWGATAGLGDTVDIYQERLDPADPHRYLFKGRYLRMERRVEHIRVKGAVPDTVTIYSTVHGPVDLFDSNRHVAYARKRSWAGAEVSSLVAWVRAMQAHNYTEWRASVAKVAVTVNNYFADKDGHIAYQFLGRFPIRPRGQDFRLPVTGDGSMEWSGFSSTLDNPAVFAPKSGVLANWNNKPQPNYHNSDYMYWSRVDRVNEIDDQLHALDGASPKSLWHVIEQISFTDVTARYFTGLIRKEQASFAGNDRTAAAAALLAGWDGAIANRESHKARPEYLLYKAFLSHLLSGLFTPIIPAGAGKEQAEKDYLEFNPIFPSLGIKIAYTTLTGSDPGHLLAGRTPTTALAAALAAGMDDMTGRFGADPGHWIEPALPHVFATQNYAGVPESVDPSPPSLPVLLNRGTENDRIVFDHGHMRFCDVTPPGESGFIAADGTRSPHYSDQLDLYADFRCKSEWLEKRDIDAHTRSTEHLNY
jgi:penicillin amidase